MNSFKLSTLSIVTWSFFSFSVLMLCELFLSYPLLIILFNILAVGFIFYYSFEHKTFPSANVFGLSMITYNVLIVSLYFTYGKFILLQGMPMLSFRAFFFFISNVFVSPITYLILLSVVKATNRQFK